MFKFFIDLYKSQLNIDFIKYKYLNFAISATITAFVLLSVFFRGINLGVDFTGGLLIEARSKNIISVIDIRDKLSGGGFGNFTVQHFGGKDNIVIKLKSINNSEIDSVKNVLVDEDLLYTKVEFVGPQFGAELVINAIVSVILSFLGVFIYLCIRFNWKFAIAGFVGLLHDFIICFAVFTFSDFEFNVSSIAALLTIIGYSINDSVVIFDRIREKMLKVKNISKLINMSINSTIFRSVFTSFTTISAVIPVILFCNGEICSFAVTVLVGVFVGTYSSIFLSSLIIHSMINR